MIIEFNFNLEAWVKQLRIEADSEDAAKEKLMSMTLADMLSAEPVVDTAISITDLESNVVARDITVTVTDVEYDFENEDMDIAVITYLAARLPKDFTFTLNDVAADTDLRELIDASIFSKTDYITKSFKFQILEEK